MTILAPGTPYWWIRCTDHGLVYEDTNRAFADAVWREHEGCAGRERYYRLNGAPEPPRFSPGFSQVFASEVRVTAWPMPSTTSELPLAPIQQVSEPPVQAFGFHGHLTATSWEPPKPDMRIEDWLAEVRLLWTLRDRLQWALGDSLLYGETRYGEMWSQVTDQYNQHTLANCRWVASRFPVTRRRESLSFSHHAEVARMEPPDQDAWLDRAAAEAMPRAELRKALKGEQPEPETHACPRCGREHRTL